MSLNGNITNAINGQPAAARNGFLGLGMSFPGNATWNYDGPISLLHLNGDEGGYLQTQGYRNWMRNGITMTNNRDMMFLGPRRNNADDVTDAVLAWCDNATAQSGFGPDNLVFAFTNGDGSGGAADLTGNAPNGREVMRLTAGGNVGLGPRFNNTNQPQSQFHINSENAVAPWLQITHQSLYSSALLPPNGAYTALRGLRMGMSGFDAYLYNQENGHLIFSTGANTAAQLSRERMRVTHVGAPGIPVNAAAGRTRVAVSADPALPLTDPRTVVHIGGRLSGQATDGVRDWMDIGFLATYDSDNMYVGLKREGPDRQDAVLAWGDNQTALVPGSGPDNLRFIFANSQYALSPGDAESKSADGKEVARFTPTGQFGVGNNSPGAANAPGTAGYVDAVLDVDGDARIRSVAQDNTLNQVLVRDPADRGRIRWRDAATLPGTGGGGFGGACGAAAAATLTQNTEVPMASHNLLFSGQDAAGARIGIGTAGCAPAATLEVSQTRGMNERTLYAENTAPISGFYSANQGGVAVAGTIRTGDAMSCEAYAIGGYFKAEASAMNIGVLGIAIGDNSLGCRTSNYGGYFLAENGTDRNTALFAQADGSIAGNLAAYINGPGVYSGSWSPSDARLKQNIRPLDEASAALARLNPVSYTFDHGAVPSLVLPRGEQYGLLAQELGEVFPNLVMRVDVPRPAGPDAEPADAARGNGIDNISVVNYEGLVPLLIAAFKEQGRRLEKLETRLAACCEQPKSLEIPVPPAGAVLPVRLEDPDGPVLGQNIPNPFESETRIPVYLPQGTGKADIRFYGYDGRILRNLPVNGRGQIYVEVDAESLAAGIYSYTLFTDGAPVETRKMIKR